MSTLGFAKLELRSILFSGENTVNRESGFEATMNKIIAVILSSLYLSLPVMAAEDSHMDNATEAVGEAWEKTKEASSETWEATKETSSEAVDATKEGSEKAWDATKEGSEKAWDATKEGVDKAVEGTKKAVGAE
ncbi:MAG: hypothetical protein OEW92_07455 [Gammaproteobacteria bacterium]|nr:hypothetical protein [Gammaproteobacteria bacterium]